MGVCPTIVPSASRRPGAPACPTSCRGPLAAGALTSDGLTLSEVDPVAVDIRVRSVSP